jgi:hypothetical protein
MNHQIVQRHGAPVAVLSVCSLVLFVSTSWSAQPAQPVSGQTPKLMDRDAEIALALSACPALVAKSAGVYVLEKSGYVKARESGNGFIAIVQHALPNSQDPQCMDAEGARTLLPRYLSVAELRAQGKTPEEIRRFVADAFAKGTFRAPARPGVDYMLSKQNLTPNSKGQVVPFPPHLMFYAPYLTNADLGLNAGLGSDGNPVGPAFVAAEGSPQALIIVPLGAHDSSEHTSSGDLATPSAGSTLMAGRSHSDAKHPR